MKYIDIKDENCYTNEDIKEIADIINSGGVLILPTDTVYGIVSDAFNAKSVERVYTLKNRDFSNPINILVSNIDMIHRCTKGISDLEEEIINKFFPGALTIVFEKDDIIPDIVTAGKSTVGIRMPDMKFLRDIIDYIRKTYCCDKLQLCR